jgi:hypothetical protein
MGVEKQVDNTAAPPQLTLDLDATDDPLLRRAAWCT